MRRLDAEAMARCFASGPDPVAFGEVVSLGQVRRSVSLADASGKTQTMYTTLELLLSIIPFITPTTETVRDLCDVVYRTTGTPVLCEPHREGAPTFDAEVCCAGSSCLPATAGASCEDGESRYHCELGELHSTGEVSCFFVVPDYCDAYPCPDAGAGGYQAQPIKTYMCCSQGICWHYISGSGSCEPGDIYFCGSGVSNADGTVTCFD